jgi:hypothetical protein
MAGLEIAIGVAVLVIGVLVLGVRAWGPGLEDVDREREAEDAAREHFDKYGDWPSGS